MGSGCAEEIRHNLERKEGAVGLWRVATLVSFLPCIVLSVAVNHQPYGDQYIVKTEDVALVYAFMAALGTGMLIMLLAFVLFAVQMASIKRQKK